MSAAMTAPEVRRASASEKAGHDLLSLWVKCCDEFLDGQRKNILERDSTPRELAEHLDALKFMIRVTLALQALSGDPDSPAQELSGEIAGKLLQLQESLKLLQNPMSEAEADALLQAAFPHGSRAGRSA